MPNNDLLQCCNNLLYTKTQYHKNAQDCIGLYFKGCNKIFHLGDDAGPHLMQWHDFSSGHNENEIDNNTCCHCLKSYNQNKGWLKCFVCQK